MTDAARIDNRHRTSRIAALYAFHYAAKHGGIKAGAKALGVSVSAVFKRVSELEARVGKVLFKRVCGKKALQLTDAGRELANRIAPAIEKLEEVLP